MDLDQVTGLRPINDPPLRFAVSSDMYGNAYQQYRIVTNRKVFRIQGKTLETTWGFINDRAVPFQELPRVFETASLAKARAEVQCLMAIIADNSWEPVDGAE